MHDLFQKCVSTRREKTDRNVWKIDKKWFPLPRNHLPFPLIGMKDSSKNTFPWDGKLKVAVARVSENGRRNGFH